MKYYELEKEEQKLLDALENGDFIAVPEAEKIKQEITTAAHQSGNKTRNINIRLSIRTVQRLKAKAVREGIPYQTLAASILHKNA